MDSQWSKLMAIVIMVTALPFEPTVTTANDYLYELLISRHLTLKLSLDEVTNGIEIAIEEI